MPRKERHPGSATLTISSLEFSSSCGTILASSTLTSMCTMETELRRRFTLRTAS